MEPSIDTEAERLVRAASDSLTAPLPGECLPCYLDRVIRDVRCDGSLRLASHYRDLMAPRATALERRLHENGACCDCEVLMNIYLSKAETVWPCETVRRGSTQPCGLWHRLRPGVLM